MPKISQHQQASNAVSYAVKKGQLIKPDRCEKCGRDGIVIQAHHYLGYEKKHHLHVRWLCELCHLRAHEKKALPLRIVPSGQSLLCPECRGATAIIDSRSAVTGIRRRRACANGHRFTTYEKIDDGVDLKALLTNLMDEARDKIIEQVHDTIERSTRGSVVVQQKRSR